jgi:hypothetical protein
VTGVVFCGSGTVLKDDMCCFGRSGTVLKGDVLFWWVWDCVER